MRFDMIWNFLSRFFYGFSFFSEFFLEIQINFCFDFSGNRKRLPTFFATAKFRSNSNSGGKNSKISRRKGRNSFWHFLSFPQVSGNASVGAKFELIEFSCPNSDLKVRDPSKHHEIVAIFKGMRLTNEANLTGSSDVLVMEYLAPRRDCRVNIRVRGSAHIDGDRLAASQRLRASWPLQSFYR